MDLEDNIEEVKVTQYEATCPQCGKEFGPDTYKRVRSQLKSHYATIHS